MMLTKGAIGNLINRYAAVLKKCSLINTFGSLAVAGMLVAGGVSGVQAESVTDTQLYDTTTTVENLDVSVTDKPNAVNIQSGANVLFTGSATTVKNIITNSEENKKNTETVKGVRMEGASGNKAIATFSANDTNIITEGVGLRADGSGRWDYGMDVRAYSDVQFTGGDVTINHFVDSNTITGTSNEDIKSYTTNGLYVRDSSTANFTNNGNVTISAEGPYGANAIVVKENTGFTAGGGHLIFDNAGTVTINSSTNRKIGTTESDGYSEGFSHANVIGVMVEAGDMTVTNEVTDFILNLNGQGLSDNGTSRSNSTVAINITDSEASATINSQKLNINVVANAQGATPTEDESYTGATGIRAQTGTVTVGSDTETKISVTENRGNAYGVITESHGKVEILGNVTITTTKVADTKGKAYALYADNSGTITVGGAGKTVHLTGDVLAKTGGTIAVQGTAYKTITNGDGSTVVGAGSAEANSSVTFDDAYLTITGGTFDDIIGGGYAEEAATSTAKNTYLTISNTSLAAGGDITGAGRASGAFSTVSGDTHVIINAVSENGYSGNVYGGGSLNGGGDVSVGGNTNVTINNAVKINETVFGGGSARGQYHFTAGEDNIYGNANVAGNTNVTVNGTASVAGIIGGGWGHRGSKTAQETTSTTFIATADVSRTTNVSIHGGTINKLIYDLSNDGKGLSLAADSGISLVGGGASSGQDAYGTATAKAGATNVSITGGTIEGAVVGGGLGYVRKRGSGSEDFGIYGGGDASVANTAKTTITGGELKANVYGGGAAVGAAVDGVPDKYFDKNNNTSTSTMKLSGGTANVGNTEVNINGGTFSGDIFGGGYALMTETLSNNLGNATASQANVTGNTNITINGGTFEEGTHIYAGGYANGIGATAKVTGTGTVTFLANNTNGYAGVTVVGAGKADNDGTVTVDKSTLAFGDATHIYNNTFSGKFKDFDHITVAKGSSVNLGVLTTEGGEANLTKNTTNFDGEGTVEASKLIVKSKDVTIANGVVKITGATVGDIQNNDATAISVNRAGVLEIEKSAVLAATETPEGENAYDLATGDGVTLDQFTVDSGGVIKLNGFTAKSLTDKQAAKIKGDLLAGSTGMINFGKDVITFTRDETDGTVAENLVVAAGAIAEGETVKVITTSDAANIKGGYGADAVKVEGATGKTVTATVNEDLTLLGTADGKLVDAGGATVNIELANDKALNLGSAGATSHDASIDSVKLGTGNSAVNAAAATYTVDSITITALGGSGIVTASAGGTLKVSGSVGDKDYYLSEVKAEGGNIVVGGELHATTVSVTGGTIVANDVRPTDIALDKGGTLTTTNLTMTSVGKGITVGSTEGGAGTLIVTGEANLKGASLFLDPAWKGNDELKDASKAVLNFKDSKIDGLLTAGQNSFIVLGDTDTKWAENAFQNSGLKWGKDDVTAALFVKRSQSLDATKGGILVDGSLTTKTDATANKAEFKANSLLAVNASSMTEKAALVGATGSSSVLTVNAGSKLLIVGGKANDTVKIVSDFKGAGSAIDSTSWSGANLTTDSKLLTATAGTFAEGKYDVTLSQNNTRSIFPKLDKNMAGLVDGMVKQIGLDPMSENYGQRFVSRAVSDSYIGSNDTKEAAATIEGAAKMAFAGAAPQMGMNLANAAGNIAGLRNSLSAAPQGAVVALNADGTSAQEGLSAGDGMKNGLGLWVMPTYQNQQGFGFESGDFETGYKSNAAGVALGADYTFNDMFRVGAQFNVGGGYAESTGDFNSTDNRFNYWGLGLYAGYQYQNFGLTADFGYSANNNELEQSLPKAMDMASLKADAKTDTITAGLRGEYKITTDAMDIVPHIGVRMTNMHMDSFNVKSDKHKVFKADDMNATVWTFPVGVTFSKDIETSNGWTIKPSLDLAIIPAAGDIEAKQDVKIVGVNGTASMESNIMDAISYQGSLGLSAKNDNGVSVGVNYTLQAGAHTTDHGVQATFRYEF